jgi:hypothetical protein
MVDDYPEQITIAATELVARKEVTAALRDGAYHCSWLGFCSDDQCMGQGFFVEMARDPSGPVQHAGYEGIAPMLEALEARGVPIAL